MERTGTILRAPIRHPRRRRDQPGWTRRAAPPVRDEVAIGQPIAGPTDPRWVLAVRTGEALNGPILPPERRDRLVRLGRTLGLSLFDANLVIAIVQDQARRGYAPADCPAAGEPQLRMVPLSPAARFTTAVGGPGALKVAWLIAMMVALELIAIGWLWS